MAGTVNTRQQYLLSNYRLGLTGASPYKKDRGTVGQALTDLHNRLCSPKPPNLVQTKKAQSKQLSSESGLDGAFNLQAQVLHGKAACPFLRKPLRRIYRRAIRFLSIFLEVCKCLSQFLSQCAKFLRFECVFCFFEGCYGFFDGSAKILEPAARGEGAIEFE